MSDCEDYCSCYVCGKTNRKIVQPQPREKRCSFAESDQARSSQNSCCSDSSSGEECAKNMKPEKCGESSRASCASMTSQDSAQALRAPEEPFNCNETYTPSGMCPPKTVGPLGKKFDCCSKYAPCGHWDNCTSKGHQHDRLFDACETCDIRGEKLIILS